jgi:hypothetical protein
MQELKHIFWNKCMCVETKAQVGYAWREICQAPEGHPRWSRKEKLPLQDRSEG